MYRIINRIQYQLVISFFTLVPALPINPNDLSVDLSILFLISDQP